MAFIATTTFWKMVMILTMPVVLAGILHMVVVKFDSLSYLKIPLHQSWFGANKTWRGVLVMPLLTLLGTYLAHLIESSFQTQLLRDVSIVGLGLSLGLGYVIPELPNSYMKRKLGVKPGEVSDQNPWLFSFIDQADSVVGCVVVYALFNVGNLTLWLSLLVLGTSIHLLLNFILWGVGLRKNPL